MGVIDIGQSGHQKQNKVSIDIPGYRGPRTGLDNSIVFARGHFLNPATDFSAGYIEVDRQQHASRGINDIFVVMVSRMGMTRLDNPSGVDMKICIRYTAKFFRVILIMFTLKHEDCKSDLAPIGF